MKIQFKDEFYDGFLKDPSKDKFRKLIQHNYGELDEIDFKEKWISKGKLSKTILSMANSGGGIIAFGIGENSDGVVDPVGLDKLKDKANINDDLAKYISPNLDYVVYDFTYDASEYGEMENRKFQVLFVNNTPDRLPFISLNGTTDLEKDVIYVRRGTKCVKAKSEEIESIINNRIDSIFKDTSDLSLDKHLEQLKTLYNELPKKINVLVRKGKPTSLQLSLTKITSAMDSFMRTKDEYEEQDNPNYPEESYELFIFQMINLKKLKIQKHLGLK